MTRTALLTLTIAAALTVSNTAQQQQPMFKSGTRTVPVYATVTDADGRLVPELTRDDFEIYDNNRKQDITIFDDEVVPFSAVLALDTSASMTLNIDFVKEAATQFVIRMHPEDNAAVADFNSKVRMSPELTSNRDALSSYIRNDMQFGNETRLWDAVHACLERLKEATGRRVVVALTDGDDFGSQYSAGDVLDRAQNEDVMVYAIGIESRFNNGARFVISKPGGAFRKMATETGGAYFELKRSADLNTTFTRVIQELHSQYLLAFSPTNLDGKEHKLEVRSKRPGLTVRARKTYIAK